MAVQPELMSGESIIWAGRPARRVILHSEDRALIPFSLMWGGFAVFWEGSAAGYWGHHSSSGTPWTFGVFWGIPFVLIGQDMIWGRFVWSAWKKRQTYYAVTNRRVIVVQNRPSHKTACAFLDTLPTLEKEGGAGSPGTLRFAQSEPMWSNQGRWSAWDSMAIGSNPVFVDVEDVDGLYRLVSELRGKASEASRGNR